MVIIIRYGHYYNNSIGTCTGIVVNTGDQTIMGRIARLTGSIVQEREYHLLLIIAIAIVIVIVVVVVVVVVVIIV